MIGYSGAFLFSNNVAVEDLDDAIEVGYNEQNRRG